MIPNHSPWINQLKRTRPVIALDKNLSTDVVIVGGGIAGVATSFFTLRNTDKKVVLIEANKIAHGATGHNAGQITSYFERPLFDIVEEFGLEMAIDGQRSIESAWILLDKIISESGLQTPMYQFTGYTGISTLEKIIESLKNNRCRVDGGLQTEGIVIAEEWGGLKEIPAKYKDLYSTAPHQDVLDLLDTNNSQYIASLSFQKGCMNSALFCEELIGYLIANYKDRFSFYEGSPVKTVQLEADGGVLEILDYKIETKRIVLCTNGFENFKIKNNVGAEIDTKFHHSVFGRIGYMSGYIESLNHPPIAISYYPKIKDNSWDPKGESYFYLTRRPHEHEGNKAYNLVCTGGPEKALPSGATYLREDACSEDSQTAIDDFLQNNYKRHPGSGTEYSFCWHGLMGYTPNGIRRIGIEPCNPVLLYNLGCNGVGILPSIFGGFRISKFLNDEEMTLTIFDPQDQRCEIKP